MSMLKIVKLRDRILWGYSIPILLLVGSAGFVFFNAREVNQKAIILRNSNNITQNLKQLELEFFRMQKAARGYYLYTMVNKNDKNRFLSEYNESVQNFEEISNQLLAEIPEESKENIIQEILTLKQEIDEGYREAMVLFDQEKPQAALTLWNQKVIDQLVEVERQIKFLENQEKQNLNQAANQQREALQLLTNVVIFSTAIAAGIAILIGLWVASGITEKMNQAAVAIASSSSQIATTIEEQERIASQQATSVNETTTTMDELGASSRQTAEQTEVAASGTQQALTLTQKGTESVQQTLTGMEALEQKVGVLATQIRQLRDQTAEIGSISQIVSNLANQTNMLALNAAVEAGRAGEQGRGFSVVAVEIRQLADQSKKSADQINLLVSDIQRKILSTVNVADESSQTVSHGMKLAQGTASVFAGVADAINQVSLSSQQISLMSKQQAIAIQQVVDTMMALNQGAAQTANGISQTKVSTQQLNEAAQNLQGMV